ncbi:hypothetical protein C8R48DRAFT_698970 [Suillus tomentosus]|nr:hypothetical protein C8R48DRAFT_698970 [Suillus tomentosus]
MGSVLFFFFQLQTCKSEPCCIRGTADFFLSNGLMMATRLSRAIKLLTYFYLTNHSTRLLPEAGVRRLLALMCICSKLSSICSDGFCRMHNENGSAGTTASGTSVRPSALRLRLRSRDETTSA